MIFTTIERLDTDYAIYIDIDGVFVEIDCCDEDGDPSEAQKAKAKIVADFICAAVRGAKP